MLKKIFISVLCAVFVIGASLLMFMTLFFLLPSKKAVSSISLPSSVRDPDLQGEKSEGSSQGTTEDEQKDIYVADVYESLTLRTEPNANNHQGDISLPQLTHMRLIEFIEGTEYAYVQVASGPFKDSTGYVNKNYITKLGDHTIRVSSDD